MAQPGIFAAMVIQATPSSIVTGIHWPGIPEPKVGSVLSVLWQLEQSQWWPADKLAQAQRRQLGLLLHYAASTVPHYQERLAAAGATPRSPVFDDERWE